MTDRLTASSITDAQLTDLYDERDRLRDDIEECRAYEQDAHRRAADAAKSAMTTCATHDRLRKEAEAVLARVHALADRWSRTPLDPGERIMYEGLRAELGLPKGQPEPVPAGLLAQITKAISDAADTFDPDQTEDAQLFEHCAEAVLAVILPNTRITAGIARDAEATVQRVIDLYERWVKAGAPPLGTSMSRWWDGHLVALRAALEPAKEQPDA